MSDGMKSLLQPLLSFWLVLVLCGGLASCGGTPGESERAPDARVAAPSTAPPSTPPAPVLTDSHLGLVASGRLSGVCDASAALRAPDGSLLVAEDEGSQLLRAPVALGALAVVAPAVDLLLRGAGVSLLAGQELDLEAAAEVGGRAEPVGIWAGSHGRRKADWTWEEGAWRVRDAAAQPNRHVLFATNLPTGGEALRLVAKPVVDLQALMLGAVSLPPDVRAALQQAEPRHTDGEGWNVEGLAFGPDRGLVVGFRSPLGPDNKALIVTLGGVDAWLDGTGPLTVGSGRWLDLGARGVRSIDWSPAHRGFLIVAGPDDAVQATQVPVASPSKKEGRPPPLAPLPGHASDFQLFRWAGGDTSPEALAADLSDLRPEILVPTADGALLVSDDGAESRRGMDCKDLRKDEPQNSEVYARWRSVVIAP
jgi:hypothetical protein